MTFGVESVDSLFARNGKINERATFVDFAFEMDVEKIDDTHKPVEVYMAGDRKLYHRIFEAGILIKGINGAIETIGGIILLSLNLDTVHHAIVWVSLLELPIGHHDVVALAIRHFSDEFSTNVKFLSAMYLLAHGLLKIGLVTALQLKRYWAYPIAIAFIALFDVYQAYRLSLHFSTLLALLTCFDVFLIYFILNEMKSARRLHYAFNG